MASSGITYGSLSDNDNDPLTLPITATEEEQPLQRKHWQLRLGETLENEKFHMTILFLILVDACCVLIQILYTFFHECQLPLSYNNSDDTSLFMMMNSNQRDGFDASDVNYLLMAFEIAEAISYIICFVFVIECVLSLVAFGPRFYLPGFPHWKLHLFDALVIGTTFVLEVGLRGKEREVAGLLIIFRFWRIVKIIEAAVMSVSYAHQEELEKLKTDYTTLEAAYKAEQARNNELLQLNKNSRY
ncbi:hypothetical protein BDF20DRAFT_866430 [Mycotypha africana]|uniref:uncharacterized protein n=1 Tax=Mycotypha africana TaxID=64632 RepID=UPI00230097E3|nr:uncharacterized protein BDF20DRAFT_866430 [Mycotypha africana]KAI8982345.1 hypothetical protein BDF20DRAFT_866430 [Mycotypha africana]